MAKEVYIIAGPNGAGKTTFAREFLPNYADCRSFINADMIAAGVSPFSPEAAAFRAGRLMLREIEEYVRRGESFGFETTLSGRSYLRTIRRLKKQGYALHIYFLWIPSVELALARIRKRVSEGGHDIPEPVARRRFERSARNFFVRYRPLADSWSLFDNSRLAPTTIATESGAGRRIIRQDLYGSLVAAEATP
jgi:predicted ABC-type ATPase